MNIFSIIFTTIFSHALAANQFNDPAAPPFMCNVPAIHHGVIVYWGNVVVPMSNQEIHPIGTLMVLQCDDGYVINGHKGSTYQSVFCLVGSDTFATPLGECMEPIEQMVPSTTPVPITVEPDQPIFEECYEQFTCDNGLCVPFDLVCDFHNDCGTNFLSFFFSV